MLRGYIKTDTGRAKLLLSRASCGSSSAGASPSRVAEAAEASDVAALLPLNPGGFSYGSAGASPSQFC